jgi:CxxC motif-containing protein
MAAKPPLRCGDVLIENIAGTGVYLVATRTLKET